MVNQVPSSSWASRIDVASIQGPWSGDNAQEAEVRAAPGWPQAAPGRWRYLPEWYVWSTQAAEVTPGRKRIGTEMVPFIEEGVAGLNEYSVVALESRLGLVLVEAPDGSILREISDGFPLHACRIHSDGSEGPGETISACGDAVTLSPQQARWFSTGAAQAGYLFRLIPRNPEDSIT
jgi:hypothetical protein